MLVEVRARGQRCIRLFVTQFLQSLTPEELALWGLLLSVCSCSLSLELDPC